MDFWTQPDTLRLREQPAGVVDREVTLVDEDVAKACQLQARDRVEHLARDEFQVGRPVPGEFGGDRVGPEERWDHVDARPLPRSHRGPEHLGLVLRAESVAALHLGGRGPEAHHRREPLRADAGKLFFGCSSCRLDGMQDPATARRDLCIAETLCLPLDLVFPGSREDRMGVGVDEAREDDAADGVEACLRPWMPRNDLRGRTHVDDPFPFDEDGAVLDDAELSPRLAGPRAGRAPQGEHLRRMEDEEGPWADRSVPARRADLVGARSHHGSGVTPTGSERTMNALPPALRIACAAFSGSSEMATMLPPPPAPVSFAPCA